MEKLKELLTKKMKDLFEEGHIIFVEFPTFCVEVGVMESDETDAYDIFCQFVRMPGDMTLIDVLKNKYPFTYPSLPDEYYNGFVSLLIDDEEYNTYINELEKLIHNENQN